MCLHVALFCVCVCGILYYVARRWPKFARIIWRTVFFIPNLYLYCCCHCLHLYFIFYRFAKQYWNHATKIKPKNREQKNLSQSIDKSFCVEINDFWWHFMSILSTTHRRHRRSIRSFCIWFKWISMSQYKSNQDFIEAFDIVSIFDTKSSSRAKTKHWLWSNTNSIWATDFPVRYGLKLRLLTVGKVTTSFD